MNGSKVKLIYISFLLIAVSCSRFESEAYMDEEDKAIVDLIPAMIDAESMLKHNDFGSARPKVYVIEDLVNSLKQTKFDSLSRQDAIGVVGKQQCTVFGN